MFSNYGSGEDSRESLGQQGDPTRQSYRKLTLNFHWKYWCWTWSSNTLATWCKEPTHWKKPWCWERLRAGRGGRNRCWDGWMASLTQLTKVWASSRRQWSLVCCCSWSWRVRHDWTTTMKSQCKTENIISITIVTHPFMAKNSKAYVLTGQYICCPLWGWRTAQMECLEEWPYWLKLQRLTEKTHIWQSGFPRTNVSWFLPSSFSVPLSRSPSSHCTASWNWKNMYICLS